MFATASKSKGLGLLSGWATAELATSAGATFLGAAATKSMGLTFGSLFGTVAT